MSEIGRNRGQCYNFTVTKRTIDATKIEISCAQTVKTLLSIKSKSKNTHTNFDSIHLNDNKKKTRVTVVDSMTGNKICLLFNLRAVLGFDWELGHKSSFPFELSLFLFLVPQLYHGEQKSCFLFWKELSFFRLKTLSNTFCKNRQKQTFCGLQLSLFVEATSFTVKPVSSEC